MIRSISEITMSKFVSLLCGEYDVLLGDGEHAGKEELRRTASDLIYRYRMTACPAQARAALMDIEDEVKIKSRLLLTKILRTMHAMGKDSEVRALLSEVGRFPDDRHTASELDSMQAECNYLMKKRDDMIAKQKPQTPEEIRESFDAEAASLMTFFRMQINLDEISAGVYANMLHQADEQVKSMKRQMKK